MTSLKVILLLSVWSVYGSAASCPLDIVIENGFYNVTTNGYILFFGCNTGFFLYGIRTAVCFGTVWSNPPPKCITNDCPRVESAGALSVEAKKEGSQLSFRCAAGFQLTRNDSIHCNGSHWSAPIPKCVQKQVNLSCDFEDINLCGWSHDSQDDFDWMWETGTTPTQGTGPSYDHTLGPKGQGHYMFIETSAPIRNGYQAILKSPFYMADKSDQCFTFWYHSFGSGSLSRLELFVWKEGEKREDLMPRFVLDYITGREWQTATIYIPLLNEPFKILFVGTRGKGYKHDIAIDDVSLGPCVKNVTSSALPITSTTELTTTMSPSTRVSEVTRNIGTTHMVTTALTQISNVPSSSSITESEKDILSQMSTSSVSNATDMKPGLNPGSPAISATKDVENSDDDRKINMMVVYIVVGVVAMIAVIVLFATVYYLQHRRRKARFFSEETGPLHNPLYDPDLDNEGE